MLSSAKRYLSFIIFFLMSSQNDMNSSPDFQLFSKTICFILEGKKREKEMEGSLDNNEPGFEKQLRSVCHLFMGGSDYQHNKNPKGAFSKGK